MQKLPEAVENRLLERGMHAMQRVSQPLRFPPSTTIITSLEVIIHYDARIGVGGYGEVYTGEWRGKSVAIKVLDKSVPDWVCPFFVSSLSDLTKCAIDDHARGPCVGESESPQYPSFLRSESTEEPRVPGVCSNGWRGYSTLFVQESVSRQSESGIYVFSFLGLALMAWNSSMMPLRGCSTFTTTE